MAKMREGMNQSKGSVHPRPAKNGGTKKTVSPKPASNLR